MYKLCETKYTQYIYNQYRYERLAATSQLSPWYPSGVGSNFSMGGLQPLESPLLPTPLYPVVPFLTPLAIHTSIYT